MGPHGAFMASHQSKIQRAAAPVHHQGVSGKGVAGIQTAIGQARGFRLCGELNLLEAGDFGCLFQLHALRWGEFDRSSDGSLGNLFSVIHQFLHLLADEVQVFPHQVPGEYPRAIRQQVHGGIRAQFHLESSYIAPCCFFYHIIGIITKVIMPICIDIDGSGKKVRFAPQTERFRLPGSGVYMAHQGLCGAEIYAYGVHGGERVRFRFWRSSA